MQIKELIRNKNFIDCVIIGHSSDDDYETRNNFIIAGADAFEKKPTSFKNIGDILAKYILNSKK